ncbi:MAG: alpha-1,4-glucan--maltose-1-phosphate maltosyltransferase, partial [Bifidobacterium sp.]|nr:alpha-1,4-glucan--maltose-1-phosphate maltosyltransferase [Bifidobacterium sp.]
LTPDYDLALDDLAKLVAATLTGWADAGVTAFRIGTPDGAPVRFWQDVIEAVAKTHPEVLFLAKDVTRSAMLEALGCAGFTQDDGTFPWHTTKGEIEAVLAAANGTAAYAHHDAFWPNTQDVRSGYLRDNGTAGHAVRAVLAAMGSPSWGLTTGYELVEAARREDGTIGTANEQYEVQVRDWATADGYGIAELVGTLNRVRREHPAAASYHDLTVLPSANPAVVAFARYVPAECTGTGKPDMLIMVVNLDCYHEQQSQIHVELTDFGLPTDGTYKVHDELTGREFDWSWDNYVALAPWADVAHILSVEF